MQVEILKKCAQALRRGELVIFPTETVYGIAANADSRRAMRRLREIKERPKGKHFTIHIHNIAQLAKFNCAPPAEVKRILKQCWPGPLTAILKTKTGKKIGFRVPDNKIALGLLKYAGVPVVAPSANISGQKAPRSVRQIPKVLKEKVAFVLDGGRTKLGISSTVVDFTGKTPKILRKGAKIKGIDV